MHTGSALQDHLRAEHKRIRALWVAPTRERFPPLPKQSKKPLSERLAEARKFRGQVSESKLHMMLNAIYNSARDDGECITDISICKDFPEEIITPGIPTIMAIQAVVAEHYNMTWDELVSLRRCQRTMLPRHIAMYLSRRLIPCSLCYIGQRFGYDHASISAAARKIEGMVAANSAFAKKIETIAALLK